MLTRRTFLFSTAAATAVACGAPAPMEPVEPPTPTWKRRTEEALKNAASWLWGKQSKHGHWRSEMYGPLRSGQSLTPFALEALTRVPTDALPFPADKAGLSLSLIHI